MKNFKKNVLHWLISFGLDPIKMFRATRGFFHYFHDLWVLKNQRLSAARDFPIELVHPCLDDRFAESGTATGHYFHQDLLVARRIYQNNPLMHVDVGSRVDGFVAHVASFRKIQIIDIRPFSKAIPNIEFMQANLMLSIPDGFSNYCDSLSCLHALEHFGLGRYGDPIDYDGYIRGLNNLHRILKKNGKLYLSVPIGPQRIEFNAHRIFSVNYLLEQFRGIYQIDHFSYVDDMGNLHTNVALTEQEITQNFGCTYGCGIFEMTKL